MRTNIIIGTSIGVLSMLILAFVTAIVIIRKRRHIAGAPEKNQVKHNTVGNQEPSLRSYLGNDNPVLEIGNNSMIGLYREVPDNALVELLDRRFPSRQHDDISESLVEALPAAYVSTTFQRSLNPLTSRAVSSGRSLLPTRMSRNHTTDTPSTGTSFAETTNDVTGDPNDLETEIASIGTSYIEREIYASYIREPLDLNRSLPPTPVSESPQLSLKPTNRQTALPTSQKRN